ncbi:MAG: hypothetical protein WAL21_00135 [Nitrososphaeraceae archaeon]
MPSITLMFFASSRDEIAFVVLILEAIKLVPPLCVSLADWAPAVAIVEAISLRTCPRAYNKKRFRCGSR